MASDMSIANPSGDSNMDLDVLKKMLINLQESDPSDWNKGILRPDLNQECSEVETNPPSPDVAVYQSHGQDQHVMSVLNPQSAGATPDNNAISTFIPEDQSERSTVTYISTDQVIESTRIYSTQNPYQTEPEHTDYNRHQATQTTTKMMAGPTNGASFSAPVMDTEDDIHNINVKDLLPFHAYTDDSQSVEQMIVKNITDALSVPENPGNENVLQAGHQTQTSPQTLGKERYHPKTQLALQPIEVCKEAAANSCVQDLTETSSTTLQTQDTLSYIGMTTFSSNKACFGTASDMIESSNLLSLFGTTQLLTQTTNTTSAESVLKTDVANGNVVNASDGTTTCVASLVSGEAYLEPSGLDLASLFDKEMTPQPEIQGVAEEAPGAESVSHSVKEGLKSKIQLDRLRRGEKELRVSFVNKPAGEPSEEEKKKIDRRKEMNRKSANQSRLNRQNRIKGLKQFIENSEIENGKLMTEIEQLREELKCLQGQLSNYAAP